MCMFTCAHRRKHLRTARYIPRKSKKQTADKTQAEVSASAVVGALKRHGALAGGV